MKNKAVQVIDGQIAEINDKILNTKIAMADLIFCTTGLTVSIPKNSFKSVKEEYIRDKYDGTK